MVQREPHDSMRTKASIQQLCKKLATMARARNLALERSRQVDPWDLLASLGANPVKQLVIFQKCIHMSIQQIAMYTNAFPLDTYM